MPTKETRAPWKSYEKAYFRAAKAARTQGWPAVLLNYGAQFHVDFQSELPVDAPRRQAMTIYYHGQFDLGVVAAPSGLFSTSAALVLEEDELRGAVDIQSHDPSSATFASGVARALARHGWKDEGPGLAFDEMYRVPPRVTPKSAVEVIVRWRRHQAADRSLPGGLDQATLTEPERILEAFECSGLSEEARRRLALFAEMLSFDDRQRPRLLRHLWSYVSECRGSRRENELVALGSAIRKLISYWPPERFDELAEVLEFGQGAPVPVEIELEVAKGLAYRVAWDGEASSAKCPRLCDAIFDLASFHSSKRAVENDLSSAIALNAIVVLALLQDERIVELVQSLSKRSLPWFVSFVRSRVCRLLSRLEAEQGRGSESLGLLGDVVRELSTVEGD